MNGNCQGNCGNAGQERCVPFFDVQNTMMHYNWANRRMLIAHGMPIQEVASIFGHEKLDTTMKYIVLDKTSVKHDYRKYA